MILAAEGTWLPEILATLAVSCGVGYLAVVYGVSRWLTRPTRRIPQAPVADAGLTLDSMEIRTSDGVRLTGWVATPAQPHGTVAMFHGMRNSREDMVDRIGLLTRAGYRCVAFDHRAHGQSEGNVTSFGYYEAHDVSAVRNLIRTSWPDDPCAALGMSMGAAALCYAEPGGWDALILEGLYYDLSRAFRSRIGGEYPGWIGFFAEGVIRLTELRLRQRLETMAPWQHMAKHAPTPMLLLTGQRDSHAPPSDTEELHRCCQEPREFHVIPDAGHIDIFDKGGEHYQNLLLDFLKRHLRQRQRLAA